jgi:hypothetical protein
MTLIESIILFIVDFKTTFADTFGTFELATTHKANVSQALKSQVKTRKPTNKRKLTNMIFIFANGIDGRKI